MWLIRVLAVLLVLTLFIYLLLRWYAHLPPLKRQRLFKTLAVCGFAALLASLILTAVVAIF